jgi:hypothetical protein
MLEVAAWIFLVLGLIFLFSLIAHIEAGKSFSIPFTVIMIIALSVCLGLGIQFFLVSMGI